MHAAYHYSLVISNFIERMGKKKKKNKREKRREEKRKERKNKTKRKCTFLSTMAQLNRL